MARASTKKAPEPGTELAPLPNKKKRRPPGKTLTSMDGTKARRIAPELVDPEYLSEEEMDKRELFAQAYVAHGGQGKSAEAAGYTGTPMSLAKTGQRLYREPWVQARIKEIRFDLLAELKITQRSVLGELSRIGFADMGQIVNEAGEILPLNKIPDATRRAVAKYKTKTRTYTENDEIVTEVESEVFFADKHVALEKLGRHTGLFGGDKDDAPGINAEDFARALGEGIARVISGKRTLEHGQ